MRKIFNPLIVVLLLVTASTVNISAQTERGCPDPAKTLLRATKSSTLSTSTPPVQGIINSLSSLPDADMLVYINAQRIINEALPKFMPPKDLENMRKGFEEAKTHAGVDPSKIDYMVIAVRFRKPTAELNFQPPEFMVVSGGDFSAEALFGLARMASQGKLRDEKYGDKNIGLMTIEPIAKESEKNPLLKSFTEMGVVSLNANTIAAGTPGYLRAAIDAGAGKDRINADNLNFLVRDPNALISFAGRPWHSFAQSFGMLGTEATARAPRCESKIGDMYAALTMDDTNFMIRGVGNADNPDTAKIFANLYTSLLRFATSSIKDPVAQQLLNGLSITAEGDEVMTRADFSQQMIMELIKKQMTPKKDEAATSAAATGATPAKPAVKRRRSRRKN